MKPILKGVLCLCLLLAPLSAAFSQLDSLIRGAYLFDSTR